MSNVLILVDLEGIIGFSSLSQVTENEKLLVVQLEKTIGILHEFSYHNITLCIVHNNNSRIASSIAHKGLCIINDFYKLVENITNFEFAIMVGFHGMRASGGVFDHSFRNDITMFSYGNKEIGEIGAFTRWFISESVPVIFVSGEGLFRHELADLQNVVTHRVKSKISIDDEQTLFNEYALFSASLIASLNEWQKMYTTYRIHSFSEKVFVTVDNKDKYTILGAEPYKFKTSGDFFIFSDLKDFFSNLIRFCTALSYATTAICRKNLAFIKMIREGIRDCKEFPSKIADKHINLIDYNDRRILANLVEMEYEDSEYC